MASSISRSTASTNNSQIFGENIKLETDSHCFFVREQSFSNGMEEKSLPLFAQKYTVRVKFTSSDLKRLRMVRKSSKTTLIITPKKKIREMDHDNLNKLVGMCIDGPVYFALWKCCRRGSLKVQKFWHKLFTWKFFRTLLRRRTSTSLTLTSCSRLFVTLLM